LLKNDRVAIRDGQHKGLEGIAVTINEEENECYIELENEEVVRCKIEHIAPLYLENKSSEAATKLSEKSKKIKKDSQKKKHKLRWVQPHSRVRIVSKDYREGRFYNLKIVV